MISYVTIGALDSEKSVAFYDATLGALGYRRAFFDNGWAGYGQSDDKQTVFVCPPFDGQPARAGNGVMVAFGADSREQVAAAHAAALANGGTDEGAPGYRPPDGDAFYAAYVRDPTGNKLALVFTKG